VVVVVVGRGQCISKYIFSKMSLLDHYYKLASDNPNERIDAGEALLKGLEAKNSEEDWTYALKRLVRGLSSSKGSARLGFSMALAELLQLRSSQISVKQYLTLVDQNFVVSSNMKGNEERGLLLGKLFALQILGKSSLWESGNSGSDDFMRFVEMIVQLSLRKSWLREPPFFALVELVKRLRDTPEYSNGLKNMFAYVDSQGLAPTCEGVALFLAVPPEQRVALNQGKPHGWLHSDPINSDNLLTLRRVIREMPVMSGDVSTNKPYIHFVWSMLLDEFSSQAGEAPRKRRKLSNSKSSSTTGSRIDLPTFWAQIVDKDFFSSDSSSERKMWGLEIFLMWAQSPQISSVVPLFSANFIKVLGIQLAAKDRNLHRISKRIASLISTVIPETRPAEVVPILSKFMSLSPNFDKLSKSKLVSQLLDQVKTNEQTVELVNVLLNMLDPSSDALKVQWICDNLVHLVRNILSKSSDDTGNDEWIGDIFRALIPLAYFVNPGAKNSENKNKAPGKDEEEDEDEDKDEDEDEDKENKEDGVSKMAQDRIMSILSTTFGRKPHGDQSSWPFTVFQTIQQFQTEHPEYEPLVEFDDETEKAKAKAEHTLTKIHKKRRSSRHVDSPQLQAFELLFSMVLLQVYGSAGDAVSMLDELLMCYHKINRQRQTQNDEGDEENSEDHILVLTEILVSLMSQQSVVLRKLSEDVWRTFADHFSPGSMGLLCDILTAQEGVQGQQSLFDVENDDNEEDEEEYYDEADDIEEDNMDDDDDDEDDGYELDAEAKARLAGTLGVNSEDDGGDSEDSMDDEQMSALDVHLSTIFRERRKQQSKAKEAREENRKAKQNIVQLKGRVLDLLDIYFQVQPANLVGLDAVEPLLQFIQTTKEPRLADKARELLKTRVCRKTNYVLSTEPEIMRCLDMIKGVQGMAASSKSTVLSLACNQVSVFLSKLVIAFDRELVSAVSSIYSASLQQWFVQGTANQTTANLFIDFINFLDTKRKQ